MLHNWTPIYTLKYEGASAFPRGLVKICISGPTLESLVQQVWAGA